MNGPNVLGGSAWVAYYHRFLMDPYGSLYQMASLGLFILNSQYSVQMQITNFSGWVYMGLFKPGQAHFV